jgi:hypothetical protein
MRAAILLVVSSLTTAGCVRAGFGVTHDDADPGDRDQSTSAEPCVATPDSDTLALYTFDSDSGNTIRDAADSHHGTLVGAPDVRHVAGRPGCGKALYLEPGNSKTHHAAVPHSPDWELTTGSVDLWVRFDNSVDPAHPGHYLGLLTRDATQVGPGHFALLRLCDGAVTARIQTKTGEGFACSAPLEEHAWYHLGINFGPAGLELHVNGKRSARKDTIQCAKYNFKCGEGITTGIAGNSNPWVLGANSWDSTEGQATPVKGPLGGALDSVRISKVRRDFSAVGAP